MTGNGFAILLIGHLIADFPLQTNRVYALKKSGWSGLALHAGIHVLVTAILLIHPWQYVGVLLTLGLAHMVTDWGKLHLKCRWMTLGFLLDQAVHIGTLYILARFIRAQDVFLPPPLLFAVLAYTTLPALLTFTSVIGQDVRRLRDYEHASDAWESRTLHLAQVLGWPLLVLLVAAVLRL